MPKIDKDIYSIHAVRLVNFHNIDCATIPVYNGGHLFLLGDNGSGKTTILDAIHYVLAAGELELNSAARFGGNKQNGRRIHGVVTAYNVDYKDGERFPDGRVTYAALELRNDNGNVVSVGIGLSIANAGAALQQWGFALDSGVAELPLLTTDKEGNEYPPDREEFKKLMQKCGGRYYTSMNTYAKAVTSRFFPTDSQYQEYRSFLNMCKAYREISSKAGNYHELFKSLLPEPEAETIRGLRLSMRALRDSHSALSALDKKCQYLHEIHIQQQGIVQAMVAINDFEAGELLLQQKEQQLELDKTGRKIAEAEAKLSALAADTARTTETADAIEKTISDLKERDTASLVETEKNRSKEHERQSAKATELENIAAKLQNLTGQASERRAGIFETFQQNSSAFSGKLAENLAQWRDLPLRETMDEFNSAMDADKPYTMLPEARIGKLLRAVAGHEERLKANFEECRARAEAAAALKQERESELNELLAAEEACPESIAGYRELLTELESRIFEASPLYLKLHWRPEVTPEIRGVLEELIGEDTLGTIVAPHDCYDDIKELLLSDYPGARCALKFNDKLPQPSPEIRVFLSQFFDAEKDSAFMNVLAREMDGIDTPKLTPDAVEWRGIFRVMTGRAPVLIGEDERRQEQARRIEEARELLKEAEKSSKNAAAVVVETEKRQKTLHRFHERLTDLCAQMQQNSRDLNALDKELGDYAEKIEKNRVELEDVRNSITELVEHLTRLRRQIKEQNLEALEKDIAEQVQRLKTAREEFTRFNTELIKTQALQEQRIANRDEIRQRLDGTIQALNRRLEHNPHIKNAETLNRMLTDHEIYTLIQCQTKIAEKREQIAAARACIRTRINEPEGIDYGFSYDEEQNELYSRDHRTLSSLLKTLQESLSEQKEILNQETRRKFEDILLVQFRESLRRRIYALEGMCNQINALLKGHIFGNNTYSLKVTPQGEYAPLVKLLRGFSDQEIGHSDELKEIFNNNMESILQTPSNQIPPILDYRNYYRYEMVLHNDSRGTKVMDTRAKGVGSGGEQAVPNYLLVMMIAHLLFDKIEGTSSRIKINSILFDEAFYGIDVARRDQLLGFAEELGLQLGIASPDQDGVKLELSNSTNIFVRKDREFQVHLFPYNWKRNKELFDQEETLGVELA